MVDLRATVEAWLADDPDPETRAELEQLLHAGDAAGLAERFGPRLAFGTAGIRGPLGAGPARMNRAVVRRVTGGLAARLDTVEGARERGVVVGRDARRNSDVFADDTGRVLAGAGFRVHRFPDPVPTPLVAFAVRHLGAAAGVVITASHNPPSDNGYKVYWSDGAQIGPPLDAEIGAAIDAAGDVRTLPLADEGITDLGGDVRDAYLQAALAVQRHPGPGDLRIVVTALHGVAGDLLTDLLRAAGFADLHPVPEQAQPDPDFPTVAFPNPEEPGALDLAFALARQVGADLVLANDPDGDRIAVGVPDEGGWRALSGDETGCVLAEHLLGHEEGPDRTVATTVVSSRLLRRIADHHGVDYAETLTGFKWLAPVAGAAEAEGKEFVLAYEQALGVMVGTAVRDKDGISASLAVADLAAARKARGQTLVDALDELARRHGLHLTAGRSLRLEGPDGQRKAGAILSGLRAAPPAEVIGLPVSQCIDYATDPQGTPPTDLLLLQLADGSRILVRPSGTEPLLKFYFEVVEPVAGDVDFPAAQRRAAQRIDTLADGFLSVAAAADRTRPPG